MPFLTFIAPLLTKVLDLIPDPALRAQQMQSIMLALQQWDSQQNEVNKIEAQNPNLFVSGWRPFIGWVCALALAYQYLVIPFATWTLAYLNVPIPGFPSIDNNLWELLCGMLGLGGLRTFEKVKGISK